MITTPEALVNALLTGGYVNVFGTLMDGRCRTRYNWRIAPCSITREDGSGKSFIVSGYVPAVSANVQSKIYVRFA